MRDPRDTTISTIGQLRAVLSAHEKEWADAGLEDFDDITLRFAISVGDENGVILRNAGLVEGEDGDEFYLVADWPGNDQLEDEDLEVHRAAQRQASERASFAFNAYSAP